MTPAVERALLRLPGVRPPGSKYRNCSRGGGSRRNTAGWRLACPASLRHPTPANLGPCDTLPERIPRALAADPQKEDAGLQVGIDLAAAMDPNAGPVPGFAGDPMQPGGNATTGPQRYVPAA
jgi:hypothetical protein